MSFQIIYDCITKLPWGISIGTILGWALSHFSSRYRDKKNDSDKLVNNAHGLLSSIAFSIAIQYSELVNTHKQIEYRLSILKKLPNQGINRVELVSAIQDFIVDDQLSIKTDTIGLLLSQLRTHRPNFRGCAEVMQSCYNSNKYYMRIVKFLKDYNDMKRSIDKDDEFFNNLISFLTQNLPVYLEQLDKDMPFIKRTHESLEPLFVLLGKKGPTIDRVVEI